MEGSLAEKIVYITNKLFEYSNLYIEVRDDINLRIPGFSLIEKDIYGRYKPIIIINSQIIPNNIEVIAHILSHEWGHHFNRHIELEPPNIENMPNFHERQQKEDEADTYAAKFIKELDFNKDPIINFFKSNPMDLENRIRILNSF